jgi:hypothetical protein
LLYISYISVNAWLGIFDFHYTCGTISITLSLYKNITNGTQYINKNVSWEPGVVVHTCNPSYLGRVGRSLEVWDWPWAKSERSYLQKFETLSKEQLKQKAGRVAQVAVYLLSNLRALNSNSSNTHTHTQTLKQKELEHGSSKQEARDSNPNTTQKKVSWWICYVRIVTVTITHLLLVFLVWFYDQFAFHPCYPKCDIVQQQQRRNQSC